LVCWEVSNLTQPRKKAFRVNRTYPKILRNRKQRIARRLDPKRRWSEQPEPMMSASNIHFEMAERSRALNYGGRWDSLGIKFIFGMDAHPKVVQLAESRAGDSRGSRRFLGLPLRAEIRIPTTEGVFPLLV
jgi:hypothetical protein